MDLYEIQNYLKKPGSYLGWNLTALLCLSNFKKNDLITVGSIFSFPPSVFIRKYTSFSGLLSVDMVKPLKRMFKDPLFSDITPDHWK